MLMDLSTIERAARAFALAASGGDEWDTLDAATRQRLKDAVCAALITMREPSPGVVRAGMRQAKRTHRSAALQIETVWQVMIDATVESCRRPDP